MEKILTNQIIYDYLSDIYTDDIVEKLEFFSDIYAPACVGVALDADGMYKLVYDYTQMCIIYMLEHPDIAKDPSFSVFYDIMMTELLFMQKNLGDHKPVVIWKYMGYLGSMARLNDDICAYLAEYEPTKDYADSIQFCDESSFLGFIGATLDGKCVVDFIPIDENADHNDDDKIYVERMKECESIMLDTTIVEAKEDDVFLTSVIISDEE